jgi:hypothetical protein
VNAINKYYLLSEYLEDDIYKCVHVIRVYNKQDIAFKTILKHVESLNLDLYEESIDNALDAGRDAIIASSVGLTFINERDYINYLIRLLQSNGVGYAPYHVAGVNVDKFQGGLF